MSLKTEDGMTVSVISASKVSNLYLRFGRATVEAKTQESEDDDDIEMGDAYGRLDDLRQQGCDG